MSTSSEHQVHGPTDPPPANMVRVCDRCGTVCAADQEWCLNCGVRMTETSQRLPGLRAAGLVVALAVLLAGGAAAASYAALRGDARKTANVPGPTTAVAQTPVTPAPVAPVTPAPVAPTATTPPTTSTAKKTPTTPKATPAPTPAPATPSTGSSSGSNGSSSGSGSSSSSGSGSSSGSSGSSSGSSGSTTPKAPSGPITFASGQGSIYDPDSVAADTGDEGNAIDGNTGSSWKVTLKAGQTGGLGYVLDFDDPTTISKLKISTSTAGLKVKILGTSKSALPEDVLDNRWDTIASEKTLKSGSNSIALKAVSGATAKYRHVLVLFTTVPGTPGTASIREFTASH